MVKSNKLKALFVTIALLTYYPFTTASASTKITPAEAKAIAKEAYIYGYPMVDNYRIQYAYFVLKGNPQYKGAYNQIINIPRVYTPEDTAIQTPNSDTPYSFVGGDLRAEPLVLTVPEIEKSRYYSIQFIDAYTHNFAYVGSRATGNGAGKFLLAGPDWNGMKPEGITEVIKSETNQVFLGYRTQLFGAEDLGNVKSIQMKYKVEPLSKYLGDAPPKAAPDLGYVKPIELKQGSTPLDFFKVLNFILSNYGPTVPSEKALMERFSKINVGPGQDFNTENYSPEVKQALKEGVAAGWKAYADFKTADIDSDKVTSGDLFGTREYLKNNYLYRMAAAILGIYGNSKAEAMYPLYTLDKAGKNLDGAKHRYTLHFAPGKYPPVHAFWSLTMYELPSSLLSANSINRYLVNSPMLPDLKKDKDGGLTLYIQHESPGKEKEANWLPAPDGPFWMAMRLYWPEDDVTSGKWTAPLVKRAP